MVTPLGWPAGECGVGPAQGKDLRVRINWVLLDMVSTSPIICQGISVRRGYR